MVKKIPFHPEHLKVMDMRPYEFEKVYPYLPQQMLEYYASMEFSSTLMIDGQIITCLGLVPLWEGVYEVWQIPSIYVEKHKLEYVKIFRQMMNTYAEKFKIHRLQTHSPADDFHNAWMEFMGFTLEGTLKQYSRFKEDFNIWARRFNYGS
jgi:hypothetical protein